MEEDVGDTALWWIRIYTDTIFQSFQGLVISMSFCFTIRGSNDLFRIIMKS